MKRVFPAHHNIPPAIERRLLEATRRHWAELPEKVREALTRFFAEGTMPEEEVFLCAMGLGRTSAAHLIDAWYYVVPSTTPALVTFPDLRMTCEMLDIIDRLDNRTSPSP